MELNQLEMLRAIADTGSFCLAAIRLNLTQSALSHQIKKLEKELGETLLIRAKPKVYPSPAGHMVLTSVDRILTEVSRVKQYFAPSGQAEMVGTLRVAGSNLGIVYLFSDLCEEFIARYPNIQLVLRAVETTLDGVKQLIARAVDVAFSTFPLDFPNLETVTLGSTENVIIVCRNHPLSSKSRTVSVEELKQFAFVRYQLGVGTRQVSDQIFSKVGGYPPILTESNDTEFIKKIVRMGLGVALVPVFTVKSEVETGKLHALRIANMTLMQEFGLAYHKGLVMRALEVFKNHCVDNRGMISCSLKGKAGVGKRPTINQRVRRDGRAGK